MDIVHADFNTLVDIETYNAPANLDIYFAKANVKWNITQAVLNSGLDKLNITIPDQVVDITGTIDIEGQPSDYFNSLHIKSVQVGFKPALTGELYPSSLELHFDNDGKLSEVVLS